MSSSLATPRGGVAWWTRGDTNAFFGLAFNILVNVLTLTGLMIGVVGVPARDVLGTVLPALGVALVLGNVYYTHLARRLARREGRSDVSVRTLTRMLNARPKKALSSPRVHQGTRNRGVAVSGRSAVLVMGQSSESDGVRQERRRVAGARREGWPSR